jgi:Uma2 family endonuclease
VATEVAEPRSLVYDADTHLRGPEYWIVNPEAESITVLRLQGDRYAEHGGFGGGTMAHSTLFKDFTVAVDAVFEAR